MLFANYSSQIMSSGYSLPGLSHFSPFVNGIIAGFIFLLIIWTLVWKGIALWHSARNNQKAWFVILLVINTAGILEIIYIAFFRKNQNTAITTTTVTHTTVSATPAPMEAPKSDLPNIGA
jgi:hypothetical protein